MLKPQSKEAFSFLTFVGNPIKIIKYRFNDEQISSLKRIQWWNFQEKDLQDIERMFWDIDEFIEKYDVV